MFNLYSKNYSFMLNEACFMTYDGYVPPLRTRARMAYLAAKYAIKGFRYEGYTPEQLAK